MASRPQEIIDRTVTTIIDPEKCIGCGLCVKVCPSGTISMQDDKAVVSGDRSLQCGHCVGVCPVDAVTAYHGLFILHSDSFGGAHVNA